MRLRWLTAAALGIVGVWPATAAHAQTPGPAAKVNAEGNFTELTGPLRFNPASVSVNVGDSVRWTNTDILVPHTATEDHGLWNLTGSYGATPANSPGFGPGAARERHFTAGTWSYFCEVHPVQMHGSVAVPVSLSDRPARARKKGRKGKRRKRVKRFEIVAVWATESLPRGQVFDLQSRRGTGDWIKVRDGTTELKGVFPAGRRGTSWRFRARVRSADEVQRASGYSPEAPITVG